MRVKIIQVWDMEIGLQLRSGTKLKRALQIAGISLKRECYRRGKSINLDTTLEQWDIICVMPDVF